MYALDKTMLAERLTAEAEALAPFISAWSGRLAVQVGAPGVAFVSSERFARCLNVDRETAPGIVQAIPAALPLAEGCVDVLFLVHVLDQAESPSAVLAEAARLLSGEGRLVVLGFRPLSPAVMRQAPARLFRPRARMLSPFRLRLLLGRAGFAWERSLGLGCGPIERRLPGPWRQHLSTSYAAIARKRVEGMTVLRPKWQQKARERQQARQAVLPGHGHAG
ncbi:MAG: methyltransferase domain-containing protein [Gammaproteobacteria bacterium]